MAATGSGLLDAVSRFRPGLPAPVESFTPRAAFAFDNGDNDPVGVPTAELARIAAEVLRRYGPDLAYYHMGGSPLGHAPLRAALAERLRRTRGMQIGAGDVLITSGSTQGLDLVNELLLEPDDCVLVEAHSYGAALTRLRRRGVRMEVATLDDDGIDVLALEERLNVLAAEGVQPKYLYVMPTIQNPTGSVLPMERRLALVALARRFGFLLFEDECYADLTWADVAPASLFALAPDACLQIGSLSKTVAPALRVGYLIAAPAVLAQILALKRDGGVGALVQLIVAEFLKAGYEDHVRTLRAALRHKCQCMIEAIEREFGVAADVQVPLGGMFVWVRLDSRIDVDRLSALARAAGVSFNAGQDWSVRPGDGTGRLRLCYAASTVDDISEGVARLARVAHDAFGAPERAGNRQAAVREG